jgi:hypothetical protein
MSLGQRFTFNQLAVLVRNIDDPTTLRQLANVIRNFDGREAEVFSAVELSANPGPVAAYLTDFSKSGMQDLSTSLRYGAGGLNELLWRHERLYDSPSRTRFAHTPLGWVVDLSVDSCWRSPQTAIIIKWLLFLAGGFLLAAAMHFGRPAPSLLERPLQVRGFHLARELLFALGFLLVVLLLSEPFLSQDSQRMEMPFRLRLPGVGASVAAGNTSAHGSIMNEKSLLTLFLFFVLQGLLYIACLVKLAEIRRQQVGARVKLKLLENEDHLFDAGLYLGLVGTISSLILVSLGVVQFSLMAAYSSTSFGIIFVSIFKIFHLRPTRRTLLISAEVEQPAEQPAAKPAQALATTA